MNRLETQRLILRSFVPSDADVLHAYLASGQVVRCEPYPPFTCEGRLRGNVFLCRNQNGEPLWQDTFICVLMPGELRNPSAH